MSLDGRDEGSHHIELAGNDDTLKAVTATVRAAITVVKAATKAAKVVTAFSAPELHLAAKILSTLLH